MLVQEKIDRIKQLAEIVEASAKGDLDNNVVLIEINPHSGSKYHITLSSYFGGIKKNSYGDTLEECISEIIASMTGEIVETHNKLQEQVRFLKEAIDKIT